MSIESVVVSNHLILCPHLLLVPSIFPSIRVFSSESALWIRWLYSTLHHSVSPETIHCLHSVSIPLTMLTLTHPTGLVFILIPLTQLLLKSSVLYTALRTMKDLLSSLHLVSQKHQPVKSFTPPWNTSFSKVPSDLTHLFIPSCDFSSCLNSSFSNIKVPPQDSVLSHLPIYVPAC